MRIGIDARLIEETGVGRYIQHLIGELAQIDKKNTYIVFVRKADDFEPPNSRWKKIVADIPWHSFTEQIIMPWVFLKENLDLLHVPYFNVPILYPKKFIVTIHDLTILHFDTGKASTWPFFFYKIRRLGYMIALKVALLRAQTVIAVSCVTKAEILDHFDISPEWVRVVYEGV